MNENICLRALKIAARMAAVFGFAALLARPAVARTISIDFENLPDANFFSASGQGIDAYYPGITMGPYVTGLSVSRFGGYGDAAYPPHSGDVVVWSPFDDVTVFSFDSDEDFVTLWYTSFDLLTLEAFNGSSSSLGTVVGFPNTDGATGSSSQLSISA